MRVVASMMKYKHKRYPGKLSLKAMNKPASICITMMLLLCSHITAGAKSSQSLADVVEQAIKRKEPGCRLVSSGITGGENPNEEEKTVRFLWKCNGKDVSVGVSNLKTLDTAGLYFTVGTTTQIMRRGYKLSDDGRRLKQMVDEAGFYKNSSPVTLKSGKYRETYDVTFRKGKIVIFVEAFRSAVAQKMALLIAESLPPA